MELETLQNNEPRHIPDNIFFLILISGFFGMLYTAFFPFRNTFIPYESLALCIGVCVLAAYFIIRLFDNYHRTYQIEKMLLVFPGITGLLFSSFFVMNFYIRSNTEIKEYKVIRDPTGSTFEYTIDVQDEELKKYPRLYEFSTEEMKGTNIAHIEIADGIFGLKVVAFKEMR